MLTAPLPGQAPSRPTEAQIATEGQGFLDLMGAAADRPDIKVR